MTCFWDAITSRLTAEERQLAGVTSATSLAAYLKGVNTRTPEITWNDESLTPQQMGENMERVRSLDVGGIGGGYDCSTCDPFLFLVAYVFDVDIDHNYMGHVMRYRNTRSAKRTLHFSSNSGHFSA